MAFGARSVRRFRSSDAIFLLFTLAQVADGCLTYAGMRTYGLSVEANPLIRWYMYALGPLGALLSAKAFAVFCGSILYVTARHSLIGILTVGYLVGVISPWVSLFLR